MDVSRKKLEDAMFRQMDIQHANLPSKVPSLDATGGVDPLEFAQMVNDNFPVLIHNAAANYQAVQRWNFDYLKEKIGSVECPVAHTAWGNADSPLHGTLFVKPHIEKMEVRDLLIQLEHKQGPVLYMQSQDDNLGKEFRPLIDSGDIPEQISWAEQALGEAEAVNLWIGDERTTSRLHNDNYENLFLQVAGEKTIYLIPPGDCYALDERFLSDATYTYNNNGEFAIQIDNTDISLPIDTTAAQLTQALAHAKTTKTLFPTVDPANPTTLRVFNQHCKVYKVKLGPGDMLFIPALWYHQVKISSSPCISVNYWYPVSSSRPLWPQWDFTG